MYVTLGQAAKQLGISKSTLSKYIHQGKLSAEKQDDGSYRIDPAELDRVRTVIRPQPEHSAEHFDTPDKHVRVPYELEQLRDLLAERDRRIDDLLHRVEDLKGERDAWRRMAESLQQEKPRQLPDGRAAMPRVWAWFRGKRDSEA